MSDGITLTADQTRETRRFVVRLSLLTGLAALIGGVVAFGVAASVAALVWVLA